jgi:hypothetical protein
MKHRGSCHCGAIGIELKTDRLPKDQVIGACQCSFCRKHNARTFSDPKARAVLTARVPEHVGSYRFGLLTSQQIVCRRCGVYVAMLLSEADSVWSVINLDTLDDRASFTQAAEPREWSAEDRATRIARRKASWTPTNLIGWPASASG